MRRSPEAIHTTHTASKRHRCEASPCTSGPSGWIEPGDRYVLSKLPPNSDIGNTTWWRARFHDGCIEPREQQP